MKNKKGYKVLNFIMKTISWCAMSILIIIAFFLVGYLVINKVAQARGDKTPLGLYTIISGSMTPDIQVYDVVFVVKKDPKDIKIGDIISYYSSKTQIFGTTPVTHRVVEKFETNRGITFRTKGDANPVVDDEIIYEDNVIGTVRFVIPQLGRIQFFLASKGGWLMVILIPALGIIIYDIIKLVKLIKVKSKIDYARSIQEDEEGTPKKSTKKTSKTNKK